MAYVAKVKNGNDNVPVGHTLYGTCATAANTAAKEVVMPDFSSIVDGVTIKVKFTNSNTAANPTLNVNSTGAKNIYRYGTTAPGATADASWEAGAVLSFTYDGTNWMMNDFQNGSGGTDHGIPAGGSSGQILTKNSGTDYDASWVNKPSYTASEVGAMALSGQVDKTGDIYVDSGDVYVESNDGESVYYDSIKTLRQSLNSLKYAGSSTPGGAADNVAHKLKMYVNSAEYDFDGSADKTLAFICLRSTGLPVSYWSATTDANGYYTATASILWHMNNDYTPTMWCMGANSGVAPTTAQIAAYNSIEKVDINDDVLTFYAKTKPTIDIYFGLKGIKVQ